MDGPGHGIGDRAGWRTWLPATALVGITLVFYHGLWMPGLALIKRDAFVFHLPIKQHMVERFSAGELPQWFPYEALGRPFIGTAATGLFHPFTVLYFLLPAPDAYRASSLLSCLLGALGAYALGRTLNFSRAGALVAGIAFTLSGYLVSALDNIVYLYSLCMLPLFLAALEKAFRASRAWSVGPAAIWASVFLNGDVQTGYYYGFIALLWAAARAPSSHRNALRRLLLAGSLAVLLAGIQLGPAAAVFMGSNRAQPEQFHKEALAWSTHPLRLVTVVAAPVGGSADPADVGRVFFDNPKKGVWAESLYLGIPVTGLALLGIWHRRDLWSLALLGGLALILALGRFGKLYELFYHIIPLWSAFRYPEKLIGVVSFASAIFAGAGFDALRAGQERSWPWLVTAILCAGGGLALRTDTVSAWTAAHFDAPQALALAMTDSAGLGFLFSAVASLGVWLVVIGARQRGLRQKLLLACLVMIIALDLSRANLGVYRTGPAEAASFTPPLAAALRAREGSLAPGRFRLISILDSQYRAPQRIYRLFGNNADTVERRQALYMEHNAQFHVETVSSYLPGYRSALAAMFHQQVGTEVAARFNVAYYIGHSAHFRDPQFAQALVASVADYDLMLVKNPIPAKPRAYLSRRPDPLGAPVDPASLLTRPDFLSGEVDVIETSAETVPGPTQGGLAVIERYDPEDVRVRVETPQPAVLILLDAFDKGWTATLDGGAELPILRANALVRAVIVPAGAHAVTFRYETPLLRAGAIASFAGALLCLGLIVQRRRVRHEGDRA